MTRKLGREEGKERQSINLWWKSREKKVEGGGREVLGRGGEEWICAGRRIKRE